MKLKYWAVFDDVRNRLSVLVGIPSVWCDIFDQKGYLITMSRFQELNESQSIAMFDGMTIMKKESWWRVGSRLFSR